jgi:hypothetical protein
MNAIRNRLPGMVFRAAIAAGALGLAALPASAGGSLSAGYANGAIALSCENGRLYPFTPRAVSDAGEIVTGYLRTSPHHAIHMRLIPMGDGYRYAGRGIWFDGKREAAVLFFGEYQTTNCVVVRDDPNVVSVKG